MKRRTFLESLGVGTMGAVVGRAMIGKQLSSMFYEEGGTYENIVIGTGYGGAVVAERLGERGCPVLMLELGLDWDKYRAENDFKFNNMSSATKESTWMNTSSQAPVPLGNINLFSKFTGILRRQDFSDVKVYMGRGIGGGSLVNGGMTVTPRADYFTEVFANAGVSIPTSEFTSKYFQMAYNNLGGNVLSDDLLATQWFDYARIGVEEGVNAGFKEVEVPNVYDFEYFRKEIKGDVPGSATEVEVIYGNNHGKRDLTKTYLKRALDTGNVTILPQHRVNYIQDNGDGTYDLNVSLIDTQAKEVANKTFKANRLFMGAGSLGTTELLLKSKAKGTMPNVDSKVGQYWGNNGNAMCSRQARDIVGHKNRGNSQCTMPVRGLDNWDSPTNSFFAEIAPMPAAGAFTGIYLVVNKLSDNPANRYGEITYDEFNDEINVNWGTANNAHMRANAEYFLDRMNKYGDKNWYGNTYKNNTIFFSDNGVDESICYHPLGGAVLGQATDMYGRLNNHNNLYVVDGALIPGTLGVNPYLTITAMAERNMETIIVEDCANCSQYSTATTALPVRMESFRVEAKGSDAMLTWKTASEVNNSHFSVMRSFDGQNFEEVGSVSGKGDTSAGHEYGYVDRYVGVDNNTVYYRLEQVDFDGAVAKLNTAIVSFGGKIETKIYPNFANVGDQITVQGHNIKNIEVYDILGSRVMKQVHSGKQMVTIQTHSFTQGVYFVVVNFKKTCKLVIK